MPKLNLIPNIYLPSIYKIIDADADVNVDAFDTDVSAAGLALSLAWAWLGDLVNEVTWPCRAPVCVW